MATACLAALAHRPTDGFDTFNVLATVPFGSDEARELGRDPWAVVERHFPGTAELIDARNHDRDELMWGWAIWSAEKARQLLGWQPAYDFASFLDAWRTDDRSLYPFADRPLWGMPPP